MQQTSDYDSCRSPVRKLSVTKRLKVRIAVRLGCVRGDCALFGVPLRTAHSVVQHLDKVSRERRRGAYVLVKKGGPMVSALGAANAELAARVAD